MGELPGAAPREKVMPFELGSANRLVQGMGWLVLAGSAISLLAINDYTQRVLEDVLIMMLFGLSLQFMMALSGWVSFGHAAYFGLGAYAAALSHLHWHFNALTAALTGVLLAVFGVCTNGVGQCQPMGVIDRR